MSKFGNVSKVIDAEDEQKERQEHIKEIETLLIKSFKLHQEHRKVTINLLSLIIKYDLQNYFTEKKMQEILFKEGFEE